MCVCVYVCVCVCVYTHTQWLSQWLIGKNPPVTQETQEIQILSLGW